MNAISPNPPAESTTPLTPNASEATPPKPNESVSLLNEAEPEKPASGTETKTDAKPEGEKKAETAGPPEKYEDFKLPEGVELAPEAVAEVSTLFKELGLSQANAQKLVDFHSKTLQATAEATLKAPLDAWMAQKATWKTEIKADPEIGGKLGEVKAQIASMYEALGPANAALVKDFKSAMDLTGAGDNPAFIKLFAKLAERLGEGKPVQGNKPPGGPKLSPAQSMYPNLPSQAS